MNFLFGFGIPRDAFTTLKVLYYETFINNIYTLNRNGLSKLIKQHWSFYLFSYSIYVCKRTPFLSCLNILKALKRSNQREEILYRWHQRIGSLRTCKQQKLDFEFIHSWQAKVKGNFFSSKFLLFFKKIQRPLNVFDMRETRLSRFVFLLQ